MEEIIVRSMRKDDLLAGLTAAGHDTSDLNTVKAIKDFADQEGLTFKEEASKATGQGGTTIQLGGRLLDICPTGTEPNPAKDEARPAQILGGALTESIRTSGGGRFVALTLLFGLRQEQIASALPQLLISGLKTGVAPDVAREALATYRQARKDGRSSAAATEAAMTAHPALEGLAPEAGQFVSIQGTWAEPGTTTYWHPVTEPGAAPEDIASIVGTTNFVAKEVETVRASRADDPFDYERGEKVSAILCFHRPSTAGSVNVRAITVVPRQVYAVAYPEATEKSAEYKYRRDVDSEAERAQRQNARLDALIAIGRAKAFLRDNPELLSDFNDPTSLVGEAIRAELGVTLAQVAAAVEAE